MASYITSRAFLLPRSSLVFAKELRYHLWSKKFWPYREVTTGDILYWYESPTKRLVWKSFIHTLEAFPYHSKEELSQKLMSFSPFDPSEPYFLKAPSRGYCLAYQVTPLQKLDLPKPKGLRIPPLGWLRVEAPFVCQWVASKDL